LGGGSRIQKSTGRRSHLKTLKDEILLAMLQVFLGYLFNFDDSNVCRHLKRIEPQLAKNLAIRKDRSLSRGDLVKIIIDVTEINVQRPKKNQKEKYSGKKKQHTSKIRLAGKVRHILLTFVSPQKYRKNIGLILNDY
jgi:hypothetical protein